MDIQNRFDILILSDNKHVAELTLKRLSAVNAWRCYIKDPVEKELCKFDDKVNVLILMYEFVKLSPDIVLQKLQQNYPNAKFLVVCSEENFLY